MNSGQKENIDKEVQKTLDLLEKNEDARVNPYFYTRLAAKLNEAPQINSVPDFFDRIRFGFIIPLVCVLLLVFNIITLAVKYNAADDSEAKRNELIESLRNEYDSISGGTMQGGYGN